VRARQTRTRDTVKQHDAAAAARTEYGDIHRARPLQRQIVQVHRGGSERPGGDGRLSALVVPCLGRSDSALVASADQQHHVGSLTTGRGTG
jgi:hypothetical protein